MRGRDVSTNSKATSLRAEGGSVPRLRAFLSYSRSSSGATQGISRDLMACGITEVWWDKNLLGAQPWWDTILAQIQQADVVVCLLEGGIRDSLAVQREYQYALDLGKPLLPLLLSDDIAISTLPIELSGKQYVDYRQSNGQRLKQLQQAILNLPTAAPLPEPLPPPPDIPRTENDYLLDRVNSLEPLSEETQNAVLNQLQRLARNADAEQLQFVKDCLHALKDRRELYARVAEDIDTLEAKLATKRTYTTKAAYGVLVLVLMGTGMYLFGQPGGISTLGKADSKNTLPEPIESPTIAADLPHSIVPKAVNEVFENQEPIADSAIDDKPEGTPADEIQIKAAQSQKLKPQVAKQAGVEPDTVVLKQENETRLVNPRDENQDPAPAVEDEVDVAGSAVSELIDKKTAELSESNTETEMLTELKTEPRTELAKTRKYENSPSWMHDLTVSPNDKFELCGFNDFSVNAVTDPSGKEWLELHSLDRALPDRTFRGWRARIREGETTELLPGCTVRADHIVTAGFSRIRFRTK